MTTPSEEKPRKSNAGRPSKQPEIDLDKVRKLSEAGLTDAQMAVALNIAVSTLYDYKLNWPKFSEAIQEGKGNPDDQVERSLFERATGYQHIEEKLFMDSKTGKIVSQSVIKQYPPDTAAAFIWLKNRRPEKWRDRTETTPPSQTEIADKLSRIADALEAKDG